ncbi:hypothetical protein T06_16208, partial [Trichinella sp. T6]
LTVNVTPDTLRPLNSGTVDGRRHVIWLRPFIMMYAFSSPKTRTSVSPAGLKREFERQVMPMSRSTTTKHKDECGIWLEDKAGTSHIQRWDFIAKTWLL